MNKIIVMNNATGQMLGRKLNTQQTLFAAKAALRNAWLARSGDIIISRMPIDDDFQHYICMMLGLESPFSIICPEQSMNYSPALSDELLLSDTLITELRRRIVEPSQWCMLPCYQTEGTARLQLLLGLSDSVGRRFAAQRGTDLLNRKSHFRQLATGAMLPLADGAVVSTPEGLASGIRHFIGSTGTVIVKRNNGAGGTGNLVITKGVVKPHPGAFETISFDSKISADELWSTMTDQDNGVLVVEVYHPAERMFYFEFYISDNGMIEYLNCGTIRVRPHDNPDAKEFFWIGLELPATLPAETYARGISEATRFVGLASQMGYRGHINIDAIFTTTHELIFNEANARWGGGTVLHSVAENLLGSRFANSHVISSFRDVSAPDLSTSLATLKRCGLHFDPQRKEGIVILASDETFTQTIETVVIGSKPDRLRQLETELLSAMRPWHQSSSERDSGKDGQFRHQSEFC